MIRIPIAIDFFADLICPWCYVGWEALKRAAEANPNYAVRVRWRNFLLAPETPPEGVDKKDYFAARYGAEPEKMSQSNAALNAAAAAAGAPLDLGAARRIPNTINAHRIVHWAAGQNVAEAAIDELFFAYFVEGRDIGAGDVLIDVAARAGLDATIVRDLLASAADADKIAALHAAAVRAGVTGVPVAVLNGKVAVMGAESAENYAAAFKEAA